MDLTTRTHLFTALRTLLGELTGRPESDVVPAATLERDLDLDSLALLELVLRAEDRFGVTLPEDVPRLVTVGDVVDWVAGVLEVDAGTQARAA